MQNASFLILTILFLDSVLYVYALFFLSKASYKMCYMNVCVFIYLWFAKMKI